jgi:membrane protein
MSDLEDKPQITGTEGTEPAAPPTNQALSRPRQAIGKSRDRLTQVKGRAEQSTAGSLWKRLSALDFMNQAFVFASLLMICVFPFLIVVSALESQNAGHSLASHIGLNREASNIVSGLFASSSATSNALTAGSIVTLVFGAVTLSGAIQGFYEQIFELPRRGMRDVHRLLGWVLFVCLFSWGAGLLGGPIRNASAGPVLLGLVSYFSLTLFFWWTMHFLLAGRVPWRDLLPSALATAFCWIGLGVFSKYYFSSTIISNNRIYGTIGVIFALLSWLIAIAVVILLGGVAGVVWREWRSERRQSRSSTE